MELHGFFLLQAVPASLGSGSLSPVIAIGTFDIQRSLAICWLAVYHRDCHKLQYLHFIWPDDVIANKVPVYLRTRGPTDARWLNLSQNLLVVPAWKGVNRRYQSV